MKSHTCNGLAEFEGTAGVMRPWRFGGVGKAVCENPRILQLFTVFYSFLHRKKDTPKDVWTNFVFPNKLGNWKK